MLRIVDADARPAPQLLGAKRRYVDEQEPALDGRQRPGRNDRGLRGFGNLGHYFLHPTKNPNTPLRGLPSHASAPARTCLLVYLPGAAEWHENKKAGNPLPL